MSRRSPDPSAYIARYRHRGVSERAIPAFCQQKVWEGEQRLKRLAASHVRPVYTPANFPVGAKRIFCNGVDLTDFAFEADFRKGHVKCYLFKDGNIVSPKVEVTRHGRLELRDA